MGSCNDSMPWPSTPARFWPPVRTPRWWPEEFGEPNSAGSQNEVQYAYFRDARRLCLREGDEVTTYDTGDHHIQGVSQASDIAHARFTSDRGEVRVEDLTRL